MRAELVRRLLAVHGVAADDEVIEFLSSRPADSARAVQGLVNRALSAIETEGGGLTVAAARAAVGGRAPRTSQQQAISAPMPAGLDPSLVSREKVVWDWPDIADRLVEELH
jgi:chromosomal replication initiation ATPase DnaA